MREALPSQTAQRVAAYRLTFDRLEAPYADPGPEERLAKDVAGALVVDRDAPMARYLRARTAIFDRVVVNALERETAQIVVVGAGYDGRSLRYAKPGVRWFEIDHPHTQRDKQTRLHILGITSSHVSFIPVDLRLGGADTALVSAGFDCDSTSLIICEGVAVYLEPATFDQLLAELRSTATVGTRLAISLSVASGTEERRAEHDRFRADVAALGEPALSHLTIDDAEAVFPAQGWRLAAVSERAQRAGLVVALPDWTRTATVAHAPTRSRLGTFMERVFRRDSTDSLAAHLEAEYRTDVSAVRQLDVGVFRVDRRDANSWIARVYSAARRLEIVHDEAQLLAWLGEQGFPAERCAAGAPVSVLDGQPVILTEFVDGAFPASTVPVFHAFGELLGRLHTLPTRPGSAQRPGGAWHHLAIEGGPHEEIVRTLDLLSEARQRVHATHAHNYDLLRSELSRCDDWSGCPQALCHPDLVPRNAIVDTASGEVVIVDWTGTGIGPRIASLGFLLWCAGRSGMPFVDAVMAGYRAHVVLELREWEQLASAVLMRPLVFASWSFEIGREDFAQVAADLPAVVKRAASIAKRAISAVR